MKEVFGDIWDYKANCVCITTNGDTNRRTGECVMGRGVAAQAKARVPGIARWIADSIQRQGNHVYYMGPYLAFPVKHHWHEKADLDLIRRSALELKELAEQFPNKVFVIGRPGCDNGRLDWNDVRLLLLDLPDNVHIITNEERPF